jgi:hypothetical protein
LHSLFSHYSHYNPLLSPALPRTACERSVNISGDALGGLAGQLKFTTERKRSTPLDHVDVRTGLKLVPPSLFHTHKPVLWWFDLASSSVYNIPNSVPQLGPEEWLNEAVQAHPCATTLRDTGTPWTLEWIYILFMLPTCKSLHRISEFSLFPGVSLRPIRSIGGRGHGEVTFRLLVISLGSSNG